MIWKKKVKDPVCGMDVDPKNAFSRAIAGTTYYFCSERCADIFEKERSRADAGSDAGGHQSHYGGDDRPHNCC